jgi:O-antigen/teichoic acid export membrane protein
MKKEVGVPGAGRRLALGLGANAIGKVWVAVSQLVTVPVLLSRWGASGYGIWLMLSAIPTYLVLSDFGFGAAAAVTMSRAIEQGDVPKALRAFQSTWALVTAMSGLILLVAVSISAISAPAPKLVELVRPGLVLAVYALVALQMSIINVGFRCVRKYALGTLLNDVAMPIEAVVLMVMASFGFRYFGCAIGMLTVRIFAAVAYYIALRMVAPDLRLGWAHATFIEIRGLTKPALAAVGMPLALALNLQGVLFALGLVYGPAAAALFGAVRTITRFPLQLAGIVTRASQPELTVAYANHNLRLVARLTVLIFAGIGLTLAPGFAAIPWTKELMSIYSHGHLSVPATFFATLYIIACIQTIWSTFVAMLYAENKQALVVHWCIIFAAITLYLPILFGKIFPIGGVALAILTCEAGLMIIIGAIWKKECGLSWTELTQATDDALRRLIRRFPLSAHPPA